MEHKVAHLLYCPFTGLGLYGGYRGKRWLRNRIKIFKQFVVPSLMAQTKKDFILWISWRHEDRSNPLVKELHQYLLTTGIQFFFTYTGVCFWDDKYSDGIAHDRLVDAIHRAVPDVLDAIGEADIILMTIQPSDDCYYKDMVQEVQHHMQDPHILATAYRRGYVMDYKTRELRLWNPTTSPPFYTIKFAREIFVDPMKHVAYAGVKSHEYVADLPGYHILSERGFLVGTHGENISTVFNHPFASILPKGVNPDMLLYDFGLGNVPPLKLKVSLRKKLMRRLPPYWQKKCRYWLGERFAARIYDFLRA